MASALYKNYLIVSATSHNRDTLEWKPGATICWRADKKQHLYQFRFNEEIFTTSESAEEHSMNAAKKWVDQRLHTLRPLSGATKNLQRPSVE